MNQRYSKSIERYYNQHIPSTSSSNTNRILMNWKNKKQLQQSRKNSKIIEIPQQNTNKHHNFFNPQQYQLKNRDPQPINQYHQFLLPKIKIKQSLAQQQTIPSLRHNFFTEPLNNYSYLKKIQLNSPAKTKQQIYEEKTQQVLSKYKLSIGYQSDFRSNYKLKKLSYDIKLMRQKQSLKRQQKKYKKIYLNLINNKPLQNQIQENYFKY